MVPGGGGEGGAGVLGGDWAGIPFGRWGRAGAGGRWGGMGGAAVRLVRRGEEGRRLRFGVRTARKGGGGGARVAKGGRGWLRGPLPRQGPPPLPPCSGR